MHIKKMNYTNYNFFIKIFIIIIEYKINEYLALVIINWDYNIIITKFENFSSKAN